MKYCVSILTSLLLVAAMGCNKKENTEELSEKAGAAAKAATPAAPTKAPEPPKQRELPAPPDVAAPPADAEKTESGLASKVLKPGTGKKKPAAHDKVTVHYSGWTTDGKMFDSSVTRGSTATFGLNQVIPGWTEGLQLMVEGEKRRLWIPESLAYRGMPGKPAGTLVFDVELFKVEEMPAPPPVPDDLKEPKGAKKTASGLMSKVLKAGKGKATPEKNSVVKVHYTGWTQSDGKMFDSSITRGTPATFPLDRVIPGWTEGVQLMKVGEQRRFWIPEELAYKGRRGPQGTLVFDVELLEILEAPKPNPGFQEAIKKMQEQRAAQEKAKAASSAKPTEAAAEKK